MDTTSTSIIDPRALLDTNAVEVAAQAVVTVLHEDIDDEGWDDIDEADQAEVRMIVRTAVSSYLLALETGENDGH